MPGATTGFGFLVQSANRPEVDTRTTPAVSWDPRQSMLGVPLPIGMDGDVRGVLGVQDRVVDYSRISFAPVVLFSQSRHTRGRRVHHINPGSDYRHHRGFA